MKLELVQPQAGTRAVDTISIISGADAAWLKANDYAAVFRYLSALTLEERDRILNAGLSLGLVTFAKEWSGRRALDHLAALEIPRGADVYLDVESVELAPLELEKAIDAWSIMLEAAGYVPGCYFGSVSLLTSEEMYARPHVRRYWHSCSRVVDRNGKEAGPACGWVIRQLYPPNIRLPCGIIADIDIFEDDYTGRRANLVRAA